MSVWKFQAFLGEGWGGGGGVEAGGIKEAEPGYTEALWGGEGGGGGMDAATDVRVVKVVQMLWGQVYRGEG